MSRDLIALYKWLDFIKLSSSFQLPPGDGLSEDDSPYLGKARFKRNEFATEGNIPNKKQQVRIPALFNVTQESTKYNSLEWSKLILLFFIK